MDIIGYTHTRDLDNKKTKDIYDFIHNWKYYKEKEKKIILKIGEKNTIYEKLEKVMLTMGKWINHILDINIEINRSEKQTTTKTFKSMKRARITEVIGALQHTSK